MLSKKKKIIVLSGMVALLVITGVLNIVLNQRVKETGGAQGQEYQSLFQTYRTDRLATRDQTMLYLDAIITSGTSSAEAVRAAEEQKLQLAVNMEMELALEGLIKAVGFDDAFITMSTENVNVIVKTNALTEDEANRILGIVVDETGRSAQHVIVIPLSTQT